MDNAFSLKTSNKYILFGGFFPALIHKRQMRNRIKRTEIRFIKTKRG